MIIYNQIPSIDKKLFGYIVPNTFIYLFDSENEYIINIDHNDIQKAVISFISNDLLKRIQSYRSDELFVCAKTGEELEVFSGRLVYWFLKHDRINDKFPRIFDDYWKITDDAGVIPIMRWIGYIRTVRDQIDLNFIINEPLRIYNKFIDNLRAIESNGIYNNISNRIEFTKYDPFTLTGRPSNHNNGVNYAALNKESGERSRFSSRYVNGFLINVDLSGFHLFLLYNILSLNFPKDIYLHLGKLYPPNVDSKAFTFKQIYGYIDESLIDKSPFKEIDGLSNLLYDGYNRGDLYTLLHDKKVRFQEDLPKNKVFNYLLQNLETEFNMVLIDDLLKSLSGLDTKLILYTYDSFLFDVKPSEISTLIFKLREIFKDIPCKLEMGFNYNSMKPYQLS